MFRTARQGHAMRAARQQHDPDIIPNVSFWVIALSAIGMVGMVVIGALWLLLIVYPTLSAHSRDLDGRYAQSELQSWFNSLRSAKGLCCSLADGYSIQNADWTVEGQRYRVRVEGQWIDVPDEAVINEPNRAKQAIVWPYKDADGAWKVRCFIVGPLA